MVTTRDKMIQNLFQYKLKFTLALQQCKCSFFFFTKLTLFQELLDKQTFYDNALTNKNIKQLSEAVSNTNIFSTNLQPTLSCS